MCEISQICVNNKERWNSIVRSFRDYDVFYLNEYVSAFMKEAPKNGAPILLYYENDKDRAINVVFCRDVALDEKFCGQIEQGRYYDLISPYGYGGFWGDISDFDSLNSAYHAFCVENHYVCEFVRFELFGEYYAHYCGKVETRTHNVIRNLEMPLDEMWMDFKQKVRKNVKKASSFGLQIVVENTGEHLQDFLDLYYSTMDRSNAESDYYFSKEFFETLNDMKDNVMYFHVLHEEKVISTELVIYGAENCYSFLGGTNREYFDMRPNDFLKYEIIQWAKNKGLKNFVLGGGYGADDGIFQYKTCLAPQGVVDFYIGKAIFDQGAYNDLINIRVKDNLDCLKSGFFPEYRA